MSFTSLHGSARATSPRQHMSWSPKALEAAVWFPPSGSGKCVRKCNKGHASPFTYPVVVRLVLVLLIEPRVFGDVCYHDRYNTPKLRSQLRHKALLNFSSFFTLVPFRTDSAGLTEIATVCSLVSEELSQD